MEREWSTAALAVVGALLVVASVGTSPPNELVHDTDPNWDVNDEAEAERYSYAVYHEENLSERAKTLYRAALESDGGYTTAVGNGAPEFEYPRVDVGPDGFGDGSTVLVVRAENSSLPPADEPPGGERFDAMTTRERVPPVGSGARLPQLLSLAGGLVLLVTAGYRRFGPA